MTDFSIGELYAVLQKAIDGGWFKGLAKDALFGNTVTCEDIERRAACLLPNSAVSGLDVRARIVSYCEYSGRKTVRFSITLRKKTDDGGVMGEVEL